PATVGRCARRSPDDEYAKLRAGVRAGARHDARPLSPSIARGGRPAAPRAERQESRASGDRMRLPERRRHAAGFPSSPGYDTPPISAPLSDSGREISHAIGRAPRSAGHSPTRNSEGCACRDDLKAAVRASSPGHSDVYSLVLLSALLGSTFPSQPSLLDGDVQQVGQPPLRGSPG